MYFCIIFSTFSWPEKNYIEKAQDLSSILNNTNVTVVVYIYHIVMNNSKKC